MIWRIREMTEGDVKRVHQIELKAHIVPWSERILHDCVVVGYNCLILEIEENNRWIIVGYIICRQKFGCCHILNLCIDTDYQTQGYGRKLIEHVLQQISQNPELLYAALEVRPSNLIALNLYQSLGFKQAEIKNDYYNEQGQIEDAILLKKVLYNNKFE